MTVLLTGASGFVGHYVSQSLPCVPLPSGLDLRDRKALTAAVAEIRPNAVIHLAAQSFVPESFRDPAETFDINFYGTFHLLAALEAAGFRGRMLFVGSGDTYGLVPTETLPVREDQPLKPRNPYAVSKVAAEALCYQWSQTGGFEIIMARPFNHIGPGQSERFAIADFARQIVEIRLGRRAPVLSVGDIDVTRDFTDVRDVVRAYGRLLADGCNGEVYNVCSGEENSVRSLLEQMILLAGVEVRIERDPARMRPAEQRRMVASFDKLHRHTGWKPRIPLKKSLKDLLDHWETVLK